MDRYSRGSSKNKESVTSEKSLKDWKLPASYSASDIYGKESSFFSTVRTVEKEIRLSESFASFPLFSKHFSRFYRKFFWLVDVRMIQVALKPTKLGSDTSAVICVCDGSSVIRRVESSLDDGPISLLFSPTYVISTSNAHHRFAIAMKIKGCKSKTLRKGESVVLMYRFHYKLGSSLLRDFGYTAVREPLAVAVERLSTGSDGGEGAVADARVDWKETAEFHVLQVGVAGLRKDELSIEVEDDGGTLKISGQRREDAEERSSGKFIRHVTLPENARLEQVKAAMKNGVLTVTVPKKEVRKKTQVKLIEISG